MRQPLPPTTPELLALQDVCARLEGAGIGYMLTGSLAMAYYARPRMTRDIDLVIELPAEAVSVLAAALGPDYHLDEEAIRDAVRTERPWNAIHLPTVVKIDLIPRKAAEYRRIEFGRRRRVDFAGAGLWIVSREDLILSKLDWAQSVNDTSPAIDAVLRARYAAMSGSARALMALQMFETAQQVVLSSLPAGLNELDRRRELCRRFYGEELARRVYGAGQNDRARK